MQEHDIKSLVPKYCHLNATISFGENNLRAYSVSARYDDPLTGNLDKRSVVVGFANDTWDNGSNKPLLLLTVGNKSTLIPEADYTYNKAVTGANPTIKVTHDFLYTDGNQQVRLYLFDRNTQYSISDETIAFADKNGTQLRPLNGVGEKPNVDLIFGLSTTVNELRQRTQDKTRLKFNPIGTFVLFEATIPGGKITVESDCFDFEGTISTTTGLTTSTPTSLVTKDFDLIKGSDRRMIYGFYCLGRPNAGYIKIKRNFDKSSVYSKYYTPAFRYNINKPVATSYDGKYINLSAKDLNWFITEWEGTDRIEINMLEGANIVAEYRDINSDEWKKANVSGSLSITGLDKTKTYELRISGLTRVRIVPWGKSNAYIKRVTQWGTAAWTTMAFAFYNCTDLDVVALDNPNLTQTKSLGYIFYGCKKLKYDNGRISLWKTSSVLVMDYMFFDASSFNQELNDWDTSKVETMNSSFQYATSFNKPLDKWQTGKVTNMARMFYGASVFNQPLNSWNVSNVTDMQGMFALSQFDNPLDKWHTGKVTNMRWMFDHTPFNQDIGMWDVSKVTDMQGMFQYAVNFNRQLHDWDVSGVKNMQKMFMVAHQFNQPLDAWKVSSVTDMTEMFNQAKSFNQNISGWDVNKVTAWTNIFISCPIAPNNKPPKFR